MTQLVCIPLHWDCTIVKSNLALQALPTIGSAGQPRAAMGDGVQVPAAVVQVTVQACGLGQVSAAGQNECMLCPSSTYSFDPGEDTCQPCPAQATCSGGATLVPHQQFWHSAPDSDHIVACPNNGACAGSTATLLACQNATYQASLDVEQVRSTGLLSPVSSCCHGPYV